MYRPRRSRKISARTLFVGLLGLALLAAWLPSAWTRPLNNVMQLLAPAQDAFYRVGTAAGDAVHTLSPPPLSPRQAAEYHRTNRTLANTLVSLSARVQELEELNRQLTGLRTAGFPPQGRLIPARVLRRDAVTWRDALLLDRGSTPSAGPGDPVISRSFVNVGARTGVADGMAVLSGEALIGRVLAAAPYTSTVLLLSDPAQQMSVRLGRLGPDRLEILPAEFLLVGVGHRHMIIEDVDHKYIDTAEIQLHDLVVSPPGEASLPLSLTIGRVVDLEPHARSPLLLYRLHVEPVVDYDSLLGVYVVDTTPQPPG